MNQSIQNGLNDLFDQIIPISGDFNKKTYADSFKNASQAIFRGHIFSRVRRVKILNMTHCKLCVIYAKKTI